MQRLATSPSVSVRGTHTPAPAAVLLQSAMILTLAYCAALLTWFCQQPLPALQDYGEWVFQGWAMGRFLAGDAVFHARYILNMFPIPNLACQWLIALTSVLVGPFLAAKVLVAAYCVTAVTTCWKAAKTFAANRPAATFISLLALVAFNACFWHGYMNYQLGLVALLWYLQASHAKRFSPLALFGISSVLYACHASTWLALVLLVAVTDRFRADRLRVAMAFVPTAGLFAAYLLRSHAASGAATHSMGLLSFVAYKCYTLAKTGPFHNLVDARGVAANSIPGLYYSGVLVNLLFAGGLLLCLAMGLRSVWRNHTTRTLLPFWCVLFLLFVLMPSDLREVVNLGERFLYILLMSLLLAVGSSPWLDRLSLAVVAGFLLTAVQIPRASIGNMQSTEAVTHEPETSGRAYSSDGLFSHRLYQNDERRIEMRDGATNFVPLLFDTSVLRERDPLRKRNSHPVPSR